MLYFVTCIYISLYYLRPFEWSPWWIGKPIFLIVGIVGVAILLLTWSHDSVKLTKNKIDVFVIGFVLSIVLSHLSHGYIGGAVDSIESFFPSLVGYFFITHSFTTQKKINIFVYILISLTVFLGYECYLQSTIGFAQGNLAPFLGHGPLRQDGTRELIIRARWYGVFNDPNDLGLALVLAVPFLINLIFNKRYLLSVASFFIIFYGIYLTNSRGAILAMITSIATYLFMRYRSLKGLIVGSFVASFIFIFGPSRILEISASESSAYGRIDAWYEGFKMFKENPLFGVGKGMFTEHFILTAHNSYVLVLAELGLFGYFFYVAIFVTPLVWVVSNMLLPRTSIAIPKEERDFICVTVGSLSGLMTAMFFLSRSYILLPFMIVGLLTAGINIIEKQSLGSKPYGKSNLYFVFVFVFASIFLLYLIVKLTI